MTARSTQQDERGSNGAAKPRQRQPSRSGLPSDPNTIGKLRSQAGDLREPPISLLQQSARKLLAKCPLSPGDCSDDIYEMIEADKLQTHMANAVPNLGPEAEHNTDVILGIVATDQMVWELV